MSDFLIYLVDNFTITISILFMIVVLFLVKRMHNFNVQNQKKAWEFLKQSQETSEKSLIVQEKILKILEKSSKKSL